MQRLWMTRGLFSHGDEEFRGNLGMEMFSMKTKSVLSPLYLTEITSVACGENHSIALTSDGESYSWGGG